MDIIIGNLCSLLATASDIFASSRKKVRDFLLAQCIGQAFYALCSIVLKGYSAAVQNGICIARNVAAAFNITGKAVEWCFVVLAVALGLVFNNLGWLGILPVVANLIYALAVVLTRERELVLKTAFLINIACYIVFNVMISNLVGAIFNVVLFVSTLLFMVRSIRSKQEA